MLTSRLRFMSPAFSRSGRTNRMRVARSYTARLARASAPAIFALAFSSAAHAQGTISFSGAQTFMQTVQTFAEYAGAVICMIGLIFSAIGFMGGRIQQGVMGLVGVIFGAGVLGWGTGWISSLTGQSVQ